MQYVQYLVIYISTFCYVCTVSYDVYENCPSFQRTQLHNIDQSAIIARTSQDIECASSQDFQIMQSFTRHTGGYFV